MSNNLVHIDGSAVSEDDLLINAYLDGDLSDEDALKLEARLEEDPTFAQEFEIFATVIAGLDDLPAESAPDDFVEKVETRIRERSRGRFFGETVYRSNLPFELVAVLMLAIMASTYLALDAPKDKNVQDVVVHGEAPVLSPSRR